MRLIIHYSIILLTLGLIDALWLTVIAKSLYQHYVGFLFQSTIQWGPIVVFYPLYALGILCLVLQPALQTQSVTAAAWRGALLGLVAYGAYDLTNHATIAKWPLAMTVVDMAWGSLLTTGVSVIAYLMISRYFKA